MSNALVLFFMFCGASMAGIMASQKRRNVGAWVVFGAFMPLIAVIAIALADARPLPELE